jgi:putative phage-type endonuclease
MRINTKEMEHEEWLQERNKYVGGSDASAAIGVNPWKSPYDLWVEKVSGISEPVDSEAVEWGKKLEDLIAKEFELRTGKKVHRVNQMFISEEHPFMAANIDRKITGEDALLECKTTNAFNSSEWRDNVPEAYYMQVMHYLAVTGYSKAYIAVLIGGQTYKHYEIERDEAKIQKLIELEQAFWARVENEEPPEIDRATKIIDLQYPDSNGETVVIEDIDTVERYIELGEQIKELEKERDFMQTLIKAELKDNETGIAGNYIVNWKSSSRKSFDTTRFKKEQKELYEEYVKESSTRTMRIKEVKQ